jgi:hypothetical protein
VQEPIVGIRIDDLIKLRGRRETSISPIQRFITVGKKIAIEKQGIPILAGHANVADKNVEFTGLEQLNCFISRPGNRYDCLGIFQNTFEQRASVYFVVYQEDAYAFNLNVNMSRAYERKARVTTFGPHIWGAMHNSKR